MLSKFSRLSRTPINRDLVIARARNARSDGNRNLTEERALSGLVGGLEGQAGGAEQLTDADEHRLQNFVAKKRIFPF